LVRTAAADCTEPVFSPPHGTHLPPRPTIFVTLPSPYMDVAPRELTKWIADAGDMRVARLDVRAERGEFVASVPAETRKVGAGYLIDHDVDSNTAEITSVARADGRALDITLRGSAIALRFLWDDGTVTIIPVHDSVVRVGETKCFGFNVPWEALATYRGFSVFAIFSDGSELRLGFAHLQIGDLVHIPSSLVGARVGSGRAPPIVVQGPERVVERSVGGWIAFAALGLFGATRLRRRRKHEPRA